MKSLHLQMKNMFLDIINYEKFSVVQSLNNEKIHFYTTSMLLGVTNWKETHKNILLSMDYPILTISYRDGRREIVDRPIFDGMIVGPLRGI